VDETPPQESDLAKKALARARSGARIPSRATRRSRPQFADDRDPKTVDAVMRTWLQDQGYEAQMGSGSLIARWQEIVGAQLADHVVPDVVRDTDSGRELVLRADSTAWATQVRLLIPQIHGRIRALLGAGVVDRISVMGPAPPRRPTGPRRVPGRGPRDTYG
jgi:predicted nucleic acid-binding Zn ribbon protein